MRLADGRKSSSGRPRPAAKSLCTSSTKKRGRDRNLVGCLVSVLGYRWGIPGSRVHHEIDDRVLGPIPVIFAIPVADESAVSAVFAELQGDGRVSCDLGVSERRNRHERIVL